MNKDIGKREDFPVMFVEMGLVSGVEVGVHKGYFSEAILRIPGIEKLYSVDIWCDTDGGFVTQIYDECRGRLSVFGVRSEIVICPSPKASERFADGSLGFVYIDANHSYEACLTDLEAWMPKVVHNGVLAGHDYKNRGVAQTREYLKPRGDAGKCRVKDAVDKFAKAHGLEIMTTRDRCRSWWFLKP
jgi:hypothetical protein